MSKATKTSASARDGAIVAVRKTKSGRVIWRVDGVTHVTSSSTAAAMDRGVKIYRKTPERLAER